jgi:hypothetical protein
MYVGVRTPTPPSHWECWGANASLPAHHTHHRLGGERMDRIHCKSNQKRARYPPAHTPLNPTDTPSSCGLPPNRLHPASRSTSKNCGLTGMDGIKARPWYTNKGLKLTLETVRVKSCPCALCLGHSSLSFLSFIVLDTLAPTTKD